MSMKIGTKTYYILVLVRLVIFWNNFEMLLEVFIPNTPRNHCIIINIIIVIVFEKCSKWSDFSS